MAKIVAYVDGFNTYYGLFGEDDEKPAQFPGHLKWLDLVALTRRLFPADDLTMLRYFTAKVRDTNKDPRKAERQQLYMDALLSLPEVRIKEGLFKLRKEKLPLWEGNEKVEVARMEEKGSDVNLATFLVKDLYEDQFDKAVVISNDSDLVTPALLVKSKGREIRIVNPTVEKDVLRVAPIPSLKVSQTDLVECQLPLKIKLKDGRVIEKPIKWAKPN